MPWFCSESSSWIMLSNLEGSVVHGNNILSGKITSSRRLLSVGLRDQSDSEYHSWWGGPSGHSTSLIFSGMYVGGTLWIFKGYIQWALEGLPEWHRLTCARVYGIAWEVSGCKKKSWLMWPYLAIIKACIFGLLLVLLVGITLRLDGTFDMLVLTSI